ncbi:MAG: hypothetical protein ABI861_05505 [Panacibacter sp.]
MKVLFPFLFLIPCFVFAQQSINGAHGTLIIAATCRDGIVIAVDSRLSLSKNNETIGIVDSVNKLYDLKGFAVCFEGNGLLDSNYFLSSTFRDYNTLHRRKESFSRAVEGYIEYMKNNYPEQLKNTFADNYFIFAGYEKKQPYIASWKPGQTSTTFNGKDSVFECTDSTTREYFGSYNPRLSCRELAIKATNAMDKYVAADKNFKAGKPFRIVMIKPNNTIVSLNNFKGQQFYTTAAFEKAVNNGEVKVYMIKDR